MALCEAALRLALEHGPDKVRVADIAEAAGVSPRTYNNYFPSREHAIVAAVTADREARIAAAVAARPSSVPLAEAITDAVLQQYTALARQHQDALMMITTDAVLRSTFVDAADQLANPLTVVIAERLGDAEELTPCVLAASVAAVVRIALDQWLRPAGGSDRSGRAGGLVVISGSLPDLLHAALGAVTPAIEAAQQRPR